MSYEVYSNFEPYEGTVSDETTITFERRSRQIVLMNDSPTKDISFKFISGGDFATLKASETIALNYWANEIIIDGDVVPYRIWVSG
jgi:hypothetical protein